jgi:tetratricopeptide (TPR) repeat protein
MKFSAFSTAIALSVSLAGVARADNAQKAAEHRSKARELELSKNHGAALVEYRSALRLDPKDAESAWRAGALELRLGRPKAAVPLLEKAVKGSLDADGAEEIDLASAYEKTGKLGDARKVLEREAAEHPEYIRVRLSLVGLLARHGICERAKYLWKQLEREPAIQKKGVVSFADDARQDLASRCEAKHMAAR